MRQSVEISKADPLLASDISDQEDAGADDEEDEDDSSSDDDIFMEEVHHHGPTEASAEGSKPAAVVDLTRSSSGNSEDGITFPLVPPSPSSFPQKSQDDSLFWKEKTSSLLSIRSPHSLLQQKTPLSQSLSSISRGNRISQLASSSFTPKNPLSQSTRIPTPASTQKLKRTATLYVLKPIE